MSFSPYDAIIDAAAACSHADADAFYAFSLLLMLPMLSSMPLPLLAVYCRAAIADVSLAAALLL